VGVLYGWSLPNFLAAQVKNKDFLLSKSKEYLESA
jgi:hypothetical protein